MREAKRASARCKKLYFAEIHYIVRLRISHSHVLIIIYVGVYRMVLFNVSFVMSP